MDIAERKRQLEATQDRLARIQAERQPAATAGRSQGPGTSPLQRSQRRQARLEKMLRAQQATFRVAVDLPAGPARPLPVPPRLLSLLAGMIANCGATVSLRQGALRIERRGSPPPVHVVELVHDHATAIAATLLAHRCPDCGRPGRLQSTSSPAGASWQFVCPQCGDAIRT